MKKILFMLLAVMGVFSSCSNKVDDLYNPDMTAALKNAQYNRAFLSQFGNIDPYHTWGFNNLGSRASIMDATALYNNWYPIDNVTEAERDAVVAEFSKERKDAVNTILIEESNFWIQQVYKGTNTYSWVDQNGAEQNGGVSSNKMELLVVYNAGNSGNVTDNSGNKTDYEHVNNFNNGNNNNVSKYENAGTTYATYVGSTLMSNIAACADATKQFGYKNTLDGAIHTEYIILEIDGSYYIGFDFCANGDTADKRIERDWVFNDWIVKITPGYPSNVYRVIAEDLGEIGDFDFNDVVFDMEIVKTNVWDNNGVQQCYANITLLAAGGTLPLYIGNKEVHEAFGVTTDVMVNTGMGEAKNPVTFRLDNCDSPDDIQITVRDGSKEYVLDTNTGEAPKKICVAPYFEWPAERQNIKDKYPEFVNYVSNQNVKWY